MHRLTIDMTDQQHQNLKALAAERGKTVKQSTLVCLFPDDAEEAAWQELKALLLARIRSGLAGNVSSKSIDDIINEEFGEEHL